MSPLSFLCLFETIAVLQALPPELLWDNNIEIDEISLFPLSPPNFPHIRWVDDIHVGAGGCLITGYAYSGAEDDNWLHSGFTEVFVLTNNLMNRPGELAAITSGPDERIATGEKPFGRDGYEYHVRDLRILLPPGEYWIGGRDAGGSGEGANYLASSDGGPDGGCPPGYPQGSCSYPFVSTDFGKTWEFNTFEHLAFLVNGLRAPGDFDGNGDVDLVDFAAFDNCATGPGGGVNVSCSVFDFDNDEDVDFTDFQVIQIVFAWERA